MLLRSILSLCALLLCVASSQAQISFRQGSFGAAIPAFGGFSPGAGATIGPLPGGGWFFRQGSAPLAVPAFGGYAPGVGITIGPFAGGTGFNQGGAPAALPAFGGFNPNAGANINFGDGNGGGNNGGGGNGGGGINAAGQRRLRLDIRRAQRAEAAGRDVTARMHYRMAIKRASGVEREQLQAKLDKLK